MAQLVMSTVFWRGLVLDGGCLACVNISCYLLYQHLPGQAAHSLIIAKSCNRFLFKRISKEVTIVSNYKVFSFVNIQFCVCVGPGFSCRQMGGTCPGLARVPFVCSVPLDHVCKSEQPGISTPI